MKCRLPGLAAAIVGSSVAGTGAQAVPAERYPTKSIRFVVPSAPGSPPDVVARLVGEKLALRLGQPVVVENKAGATGIIGLETLARAAPDGHTLGMLAMPYVVAQNLVAKVPYDLKKDLAPVTLISWNYNVLVVTSDLPYRSLHELLSAAKAKPGTVRFSSGGNGTPPHLATELLKRDAAVDLLHVPYKGAAAATQGLLTAEVDMMIGPVEALSSHIKAGRLRPLATSAPRRIASYPEVPTFVELGYPAVQLRNWQGVVVPAMTARKLIAELHQEIRNAVLAPDLRARLEQFDMEIAAAGPDQFAAHIALEVERWRKSVRELRITID